MGGDPSTSVLPIPIRGSVSDACGFQVWSRSEDTPVAGVGVCLTQEDWGLCTLLHSSVT